MIFRDFPLDQAKGIVLAHTLRLGGQTLKKGRTLTDDDIAQIVGSGIASVLGAKLQHDDIGEDTAATTLADVSSGRGVRVGNPMGGRCNFYALSDGLLKLNRDGVNALNLSSNEITIATLEDHSIVKPGDVIATLKIIPLAIKHSVLTEGLSIATRSSTPLVDVSRFSMLKVGLVLSKYDGMKESILRSTIEATHARLREVRAQLQYTTICGHSVLELNRAITESKAHPIDVLLISGASVTIDERDVVPAALTRAGGHVVHFGMPVEPGNMLLLGQFRNTVVVNLPGCGRSPKLNGLDWVLRRMAAGMPVAAKDIQLMGIGGLIKNLTPRAKKQMPVSAKEELKRQPQPRIVGVVLAAGDKSDAEFSELLNPISAKPAIWHTISEATNSGIDKVVVVVPHGDTQLASAIESLDCVVVTDGAQSTGLGSSIRAGLEAIRTAVDGVLIALGNMPYLRRELIDQLIGAFDPLRDRDIIVPFDNGRRGNPILWSSRYIPELMGLQADEGGRALLSQYAGRVWDVPVRDSFESAGAEKMRADEMYVTRKEIGVGDV